MKEKEAQQALNEIREMMSQSGRFISLSGMSGIVIGILTILSVTLFSFWFKVPPLHSDKILTKMTQSELNIIYFSAMGLFLCSITIAYFMAKQRSKQTNQLFWSAASKHLFQHLTIPLTAGLLFCSVLFFNSDDNAISVSLLIYGLSLFASSQYTISSIRNLGLAQIVLSIASVLFPNYRLLIWTLGFGLLHVVYGAFVQINQSKL